MDAELDTGVSTASTNEGGTGEKSPSSLSSYSKVFDEWFPYYLAIGMSSDEYWNGDNELPRSFRKAHEMKQDMDNHKAWLQGMYVYEAICDASPLFQMHMKKSKVKAHPYSSKPYDIRPKKEVDPETQERVAMENSKLHFQSMVRMTNQKFKE